jgi:outer membrane PBP1 activator LpoA protein
MMLGTEDTNTSPGLTRAAFARTGEPKRLLEIDGDHYSIYPWVKGHNFDTVSQAAAEWFVQNLGA